MNDLTATELKVINRLSEARNKAVHLGATVQGLIDALPFSGTPVNAVCGVVTLDITSVVIHGETVTVGEDVYEFLATVTQTPTLPANVPVNINANMVKASRALTIDTRPIAGDTMTIGTRVYTFVPVGTDTADREISIGADLSGAQANIVAAINGTDEFNIPHPLVSVSVFANDICTVTALVGGTVGNTIATTETFTAETNVFAGVTLASGANCSAANAKTAFLSAFNANDAQDITATSGDGTTVVLTADIAGAASEAVLVDDGMANASFNHPHLLGGVNGTVGPKGTMMFDSGFLYLAIDVNTVAGSYWRKVSLGTVY